MNEYDFSPVINQMYSRVAEVERLAEEAEGLSRKDELVRIKDFAELFASRDEFWKRYVYISELDDDLTKRVLEVLTLEKKTSEELMDIARELMTLSRRTGVAATTVLGAIRRLSDRNAELVEEQKTEILRLREYEEAFYEMGGTPGDEEE